MIAFVRAMERRCHVIRRLNVSLPGNPMPFCRPPPHKSTRCRSSDPTREQRTGVGAAVLVAPDHRIGQDLVAWRRGRRDLVPTDDGTSERNCRAPAELQDVASIEDRGESQRLVVRVTAAYVVNAKSVSTATFANGADRSSE